MSGGESPSNSEETSETSPETRKRFSVQDLTHHLHDWVITLTKRGAFDVPGKDGKLRTYHPARTVYDFYCQRLAANDSKPRGFQRGFVMPGCSVPAVVAESTGLGRQAVTDANRWLHAQGFIQISNVQPDHQRDIEIMSFDRESERIRLKTLAETGPHALPELTTGRPSRGRTNSRNSHQTGVNSRQTGVSEPETPTRQAHTSSDPSIYIPDSYTSERAQARASIEVADEDEIEEGKRASASPPPGAGGQPARDRADVPVYRWLIEYVGSLEVSCRLSPRGRPRSGEKAFSGTLEEFRQKYPGLENFQVDDSAREAPSDHVPASRPGRAKRMATGRAAPQDRYDNTFHYGVARDGVPYFSREEKSRKTDEGTATLTTEEAVKFFRLREEGEDAWIEYKHELYDKYRTA